MTPGNHVIRRSGYCACALIHSNRPEEEGRRRRRMAEDANGGCAAADGRSNGSAADGNHILTDAVKEKKNHHPFMEFVS